MQYVFWVSLIAGLATAFGGSAVLLVKKTSPKVLGFLLGGAAGVMLAVVAMDLLPESIVQGSRTAAATGVTVGMVFMLGLETILNRVTPHRQNRSKYIRMGLLVAIGIALHDLPEGLAIGAGFAATQRLGLDLAIAIGLHNIPEGVSMAVPFHYAKQPAWKIVLLCLLVSFVTPLGAVAAVFIMSITPGLIASSLAFAAGAMIFVVMHELIPTSHEASQFLMTVGLTLGLVVIILWL